MRQIAADIESTGLGRDDRIIEVAGVELVDALPTGKEFYRRIDPGIPIPYDATLIHGITDAMVRGLPAFSAITAELLEFFGDATLIFHNAPFDTRMLNAELGHYEQLTNAIIDTIPMAKERFPGASYALANLCRRFKINRTGAHGALPDARMLAKVYLELLGGRQRSLEMQASELIYCCPPRIPRIARPHRATSAELIAHREMMATITNALWGEIP